MTTIVDDPSFPARPTTFSARPSTPDRVDRRVVCATALVVLASLVILLPLLPGADAAWSGIQWRASTAVLFIGGAVLAVAAIAASLIGATRRGEH